MLFQLPVDIKSEHKILGGAETVSEVSGRELAEFSLPNIDHCLVDAGSGSLISHRGQNQSDYIIVRNL